MHGRVYEKAAIPCRYKRLNSNQGLTGYKPVSLPTELKIHTTKLPAFLQGVCKKIMRGILLTENLRGQDSNLRPPAYEAGELPDCSTSQYAPPQRRRIPEPGPAVQSLYTTNLYHHRIGPVWIFPFSALTS